MGVKRVSRSRFGDSNNDKCISNSPNPSKISDKLDRVRSTVFLERTRGRGWGGVGGVANQLNVGTVSKAILGELLRDGMKPIWAFLSALIPP